jgi:hypothetical protein
MTDERFEDFLRRTLDELEPVPPAPREQMWAQIDQARRFTRQAERKSSRRVWINWGVGLAAMLAVGVGIGRMTARPEIGPAAPAAAPLADVTPNPMTYRVAVQQHLNRAETLLTSFRTQPNATANADLQLALLARDLLSSTRLLLDSPAAQDPKVAALLVDLELILAQVARMTNPSADEREIIQEGLDRTAVLPRLRATTSGPSAAGT